MEERAHYNGERASPPDESQVSVSSADWQMCLSSMCTPHTQGWSGNLAGDPGVCCGRASHADALRPYEANQGV